MLDNLSYPLQILFLRTTFLRSRRPPRLLQKPREEEVSLVELLGTNSRLIRGVIVALKNPRLVIKPEDKGRKIFLSCDYLGQPIRKR